MTVVDRNKIDLVYTEENKVILCVSDHLTWESEDLKNHWEILQLKLKDYMGYIHSGQLKEQYTNGIPCIKILFSYEWPDVVEKFLNKLKDLYNEYGCELTWEYDPK